MITTIAQSKSRKSSRGGFSLVEMMITVGILSMTIAVGLSAVTFISQSSTSLTNYTLMSTKGRHALEEIARDLRMGYNVRFASTTRLDFDIYGKAGTTQNVVFNYNSNDKILYRTEDFGTSEVVLEDLTNFRFNYYNLRRIATTAPISIKEVQLEGMMKRTSLVLTNTDYIISARYMMRNRTVND